MDGCRDCLQLFFGFSLPFFFVMMIVGVGVYDIWMIFGLGVYEVLMIVGFALL